MSEEKLRQSLVKASGDRIWGVMVAIRDLLKDERHSCEAQLQAIRRLTQTMDKDVRQYAVARGFSDVEV